ncbi:MAG: hypothetical protein Q9227_006563 [Pyrenula ochraceoflavens]
MAAPPSNKSLSDDYSSILPLQGVSSMLSRTISLATIHLSVRQPSKSEIHIEQSVSASAASVPGTNEDYVLDWEWRESQDPFFGEVRGRSRWIARGEVGGEDGYFGEGKWEEEKGGELVQAVSEEGKEGGGWKAVHVWGFEEIGDGRRYVRRVVVRGKGGEMKKPFLLDHRALREFERDELAKYLRSEQERHSEDTLTGEIFDCVESNSIPPDVGALWVRVSKTNSSVILGLQQQYSCIIRRTAISSFGKKLKGPHWQLLWNEANGASGILELLGRFSVADVKQFCRLIAQSSNKARITARENAIEEVLKGLLPSVFPEANPKSTDKRPLAAVYIQMAPACSSDFVRDMLQKTAIFKKQELPTRYLIRVFAPMFRSFALDALFSDVQSRWDVWDYLPALLGHEPPLPSDVPECSASMQFCIEVLRRLVLHKERVMNLDLFFSSLALPFLRRASKRKLPPHVLKEALRLMILYIEAEPQGMSDFSFGNARAVHQRANLEFYPLVAQCWSMLPDDLEEELVGATKLLNGGLGGKGVETVFQKIRKRNRYRLFQLYCLHESGLQADIEDDSGLRKIGERTWDSSIFFLFHEDHGLRLLQDLSRVRPENDYIRAIHGGRTIRGLAKEPNSGYGDPNILLTHLQQMLYGLPSVEVAEADLEKRKMKALRSREQSDRAFWARNAIIYSIGTGSLQLYHSTLLWAQRYVRDPLTLKTLIGASTTLTSEGIRLLAFPPLKNRKLTANIVRSHISKANEILLTFVETARLALREPSYQASDWSTPFSLFRLVLDIRIARIESVQMAANLSETDAYEFIWSPTLEMLLKVETTGHQDGYEALNLRDVGGPLKSGRFLSLEKLPSIFSPSTYRFLDNLAIQRDKFWKTLRPRLHHAAAALPAPWPSGLPIQSLVENYDVARGEADGQMPYIASRASSVVFIDPGEALSSLPEDEDMKQAIGCFVDSFRMALELYVFQAAEQEERKSRLREAWLYATKDLTRGRMSAKEAQRFWEPTFRPTANYIEWQLLPEDEVYKYPIILDHVEPGISTEWNPIEAMPAKHNARILQPTIIDCMRAISKSSGNLLSKLYVPEPRTEGVLPPSVWSTPNSRTTREGKIALAMLYIDATRSPAKNSSRILASAFPSDSDMRYPPLFLDSDFLATHSPSELDAVWALEDTKVRSSIPPVLLRTFTRQLLGKLSTLKSEDPQISSFEQVTYSLLRALCEGDNPALASDLVMHTILERPDARSWHRQLLTQQFMRRLSPIAAKECLMAFATGVQENLRLAKENKVDVSYDEKSTKPFVKVTTVKFLAQFLGNADFISAQDSLDVLTDLLHNASHIDIRVAIIDTMVEIIPRTEDSASSHLAEQVFNSLSLLIPVISGLNERYQLTENDWTTAVNAGQPPEIESSLSGPLLNAFLGTVKSQLQPDWVRRNMIQRIILPAVEASISVHRRWLQIFLSKFNASTQDLDLPLPPVRSALLTNLLSSPSMHHIPANLVELHHKITMTNMRPSPRLRAVLQALGSNHALLASNAGKHFISHFRLGPNAYNHGGFCFSRLLTTSRETEWKDVSISMIQSYVLEEMSALLELEDPTFAVWDGWVRQLEPNTLPQVHEANGKAWLEHARPVLDKIVRHVQARREDPSWQQDPNRKLRILPDNYSLQTWLLPYPAFQSGTPEQSSQEKCSIFVGSVSDELRSFLQDGLAGHLDDLAVLTGAVMRNRTVDERVLIAAMLGQVSKGQRPTELQYLGVNIATRLLEKLRRRNLNAKLKRAVDTLLDGWKTSPDNRLRTRAFRFQKMMGPDE